MGDPEHGSRTPLGEVQNNFVGAGHPVSKASSRSRLHKDSNIQQIPTGSFRATGSQSRIPRQGRRSNNAGNRPVPGTAVSVAGQHPEVSSVPSHGFTLTYSNPSFNAPPYELDQMDGGGEDLTPTPTQDPHLRTPGVTRWLRTLSPPSAAPERPGGSFIADTTIPASPPPPSSVGRSSLATPLAHNILNRMQHPSQEMGGMGRIMDAFLRTAPQMLSPEPGDHRSSTSMNSHDTDWEQGVTPEAFDSLSSVAEDEPRFGGLEILKQEDRSQVEPQSFADSAGPVSVESAPIPASVWAASSLPDISESGSVAEPRNEALPDRGSPVSVACAATIASTPTTAFMTPALTLLNTSGVSQRQQLQGYRTPREDEATPGGQFQSGPPTFRALVATDEIKQVNDKADSLPGQSSLGVLLPTQGSSVASTPASSAFSFGASGAHQLMASNPEDPAAADTPRPVGGWLVTEGTPVLISGGTGTGILNEGVNAAQEGVDSKAENGIAAAIVASSSEEPVDVHPSSSSRTTTAGANPFKAMLAHLRGPAYESPAVFAGQHKEGDEEDGPTALPQAIAIQVKQSSRMALDAGQAVDSPHSPSRMTPMPLISVGRKSSVAVENDHEDDGNNEIVSWAPEQEQDIGKSKAHDDDDEIYTGVVIERLAEEISSSSLGANATPEATLGEAAAQAATTVSNRIDEISSAAALATPVAKPVPTIDQHIVISTPLHNTTTSATPVPGQGSMTCWAARRGLALSTPARADLHQLWSAAGAANAERERGSALQLELESARAELAAMGLAREAAQAERAAAEEELSSARAAAQHMVGLAARIQELFVACEEEKSALVAELGAQRAERDATRIEALERELEEQRAARLAAESAARDVEERMAIGKSDAREADNNGGDHSALECNQQSKISALKMLAPDENDVTADTDTVSSSPVLELRVAMGRLCAALSKLHEQGSSGVPATPRIRRLLRASAAELVGVRAMLEEVPNSPALLTQATMLRTLRRVRGVRLEGLTPGGTFDNVEPRFLPTNHIAVATDDSQFSRQRRIAPGDGSAYLVRELTSSNPSSSRRVAENDDDDDSDLEPLPVRQLSLRSDDEEEDQQVCHDDATSPEKASSIAGGFDNEERSAMTCSPATTVTLDYQTLCGSIARLQGRSPRTAEQYSQQKSTASSLRTMMIEESEDLKSSQQCVADSLLVDQSNRSPQSEAEDQDHTAIVHVDGFVVTDVPQSHISQVREMVSYYESLARGEPQSAEEPSHCDDEKTTEKATAHLGQGSVVPLVAATYPWKPISEEDMGVDSSESGGALPDIDTMQDGYEERPQYNNKEEGSSISAPADVSSDQGIGRLPSDIVEMGQDQGMPWQSIELAASSCGKDDPHHQPSGPDDDDEAASWEVRSDESSSSHAADDLDAGPASQELDGWTLEEGDGFEQGPSNNDDDVLPIHNKTASQTPMSSSSIGTQVTGNSLGAAATQTLAPATVYKTPMDELLFPTPSTGAIPTTRTGHHLVQHFNFGQTQTSPYSPPKSLAFSPVVVKPDLATKEEEQEEATWPATLRSEEEEEEDHLGMSVSPSSNDGDAGVHLDRALQQSSPIAYEAIVDAETTMTTATVVEQGKLLGLGEPSPSTPTSMSVLKVTTGRTTTAMDNHLLRTPVGLASATNATPRSAISSSKKEARSTPGSAFSIGALRGESAANLQVQVRGRLDKLKADLRAAQDKMATVNTGLTTMEFGATPSSVERSKSRALDVGKDETASQRHESETIPRASAISSSSSRTTSARTVSFAAGQDLGQTPSRSTGSSWRPPTPGTALHGNDDGKRSGFAQHQASTLSSSVVAEKARTVGLSSSSDSEEEGNTFTIRATPAARTGKAVSPLPVTPALQQFDPAAAGETPSLTDASSFSFTPLLNARHNYNGRALGLPPRPRRNPTASEDREFRRRAAALNIHVSPYFRSEK